MQQVGDIPGVTSWQEKGRPDNTNNTSTPCSKIEEEEKMQERQIC